MASTPDTARQRQRPACCACETAFAARVDDAARIDAMGEDAKRFGCFHVNGYSASALAYGSAGNGRIPANSVLMFNVEMVSFN